MDKSNEDADIVCTLNEAEFRQRRALARQTILPRIVKYHRISNGIKLSFEDSPETHPAVEAFIILEQKCCGFLNFELDSKPSSPNNVFELAITGPEGATEFIDLFIQLIEEKEAGTDDQHAA